MICWNFGMRHLHISFFCWMKSWRKNLALSSNKRVFKPSCSFKIPHFLLFTLGLIQHFLTLFQKVSSCYSIFSSNPFFCSCPTPKFEDWLSFQVSNCELEVLLWLLATWCSGGKLFLSLWGDCITNLLYLPHRDTRDNTLWEGEAPFFLSPDGLPDGFSWCFLWKLLVVRTGSGTPVISSSQQLLSAPTHLQLQLFTNCCHSNFCHHWFPLTLRSIIPQILLTPVP